MSTLRVDSLLNAAGTDTPAIDGLAKAWVNFNGTGTVAIRAAFNVSSITDNGTGDYSVNFTNALPDANYSAVATGSFESLSGGSAAGRAVENYRSGAFNASFYRFTNFITSTTAAVDGVQMTAVVFR